MREAVRHIATIGITFALCLGSTLAHAATNQSQATEFRDYWVRVDVDRDRLITKEEYDRDNERFFQEADKDRDLILTPEEVKKQVAIEHAIMYQRKKNASQGNAAKKAVVPPRPSSLTGTQPAVPKATPHQIQPPQAVKPEPTPAAKMTRKKINQ